MVTAYKSDLTKIYSDLADSIEKLNKLPLKEFTAQQFKASVISAFENAMNLILRLTKRREMTIHSI